MDVLTSFLIKFVSMSVIVVSGEILRLRAFSFLSLQLKHLLGLQCYIVANVAGKWLTFETKSCFQVCQVYNGNNNTTIFEIISQFLNVQRILNSSPSCIHLVDNP